MSENASKDTVNQTPSGIFDGGGHEQAGFEAGMGIPDLQKTLANPNNLSPTQAIYLQRTIGNQALMRMMGQRDLASSPNISLQMKRDSSSTGVYPSHTFSDGRTFSFKPSGYQMVQRVKGGEGTKPPPAKPVYILPNKKYQEKKGFFGRLFSKNDWIDKTNSNQLSELKAPTPSGKVVEGELGTGEAVRVNKEFTIKDPTKLQKDIIAKAKIAENPALLKDHQGPYIGAKKDFWVYDAKKKDYTDGPYTYKTPRIIEGAKASKSGNFYYGKDGKDKIKVPKQNTVTGGWKKVASSEPLFQQGQPNEQDVLQGQIGDCYLMAALSSLAAQQPQAIRTMMVDQGDIVSVRLYAVDQSNQSNHTFNARYISVEKSLAMIPGGSALYNKGALWVTILEKAYAAGGFSGDSEKKKLDPIQMANIDGGFSRHAFEVLTGKQATSETLEGGPRLDSSNNFSFNKQSGWRENLVWSSNSTVEVPWDRKTVANIEKVKKGPKPKDYTPISVYKPVFNQNKKQVDNWYSYIKSSPNPVEKMFAEQNTDRGKGFATQITIQNFETLFKKDNLNSATSKSVVNYIKSQKLYPGELSEKTADYSQNQLDRFNDIKTALSQGKAVTINTYQFPTKKKTGKKGHSGGEAMADGVVGGHAYSLLAVKENTTITGSGAGTLKMIEIRNPWGAYGREYDFSQVLPAEPGKAIEQGNGRFWLELRDLTRYFSSVDYSG